MPEAAGILAQLLDEGIRKGDSFLCDECAARRLADEGVRAIEGRSFVAGWQLTVETPLTQRRLNIYADAQFPLSVPRFVLVDRPVFPAWPHVEEDGLMCLSESTVAKFREPQNVLGELLREAYRLICDCESGVLEDDFRTEFYTYWNRLVTTSDQIVRSLVEAHGPSRIVQVWTGQSHPVIGESEQQVLGWLRNFGGNKPQFDDTEEACLLWLGKALLPNQYPNTAADIYRLAGQLPDGKYLLERLSKKEKGPFYFLIGAESGNGPCFAAVRTSHPLSATVRGGKRDRTADGFRPGKVPTSLQALRLFSSDAPATRLKVERADAQWVHGRGHDPRQQELGGKTVIVFGCGSVGSPLAHQLAMAGVGYTILVDPQDLTWGNVGRHPLGATHVGSKKALSLAATLASAYPHSKFQGFPLTSHEFVKQHPELMKTADLVICAVADWKAELELSVRQRSEEFAAPLLDVWTEGHACAGHAVVVFPTGACLQCGFEISGNSKFSITKWPRGSTERMEAACGAIFQPYGPVELLGTVATAARLALDVLLKKVTRATRRVWAGPERLLVEAEGAWSEEWIMGDSNRRRGAFEEELAWERDPKCAICGDGTESGRHSLMKLENLPNASSSAPQC